MTNPMYMRTIRASAAVLSMTFAMLGIAAGTASAGATIGQVSMTAPGYCKTNPYDMIQGGAASAAYTVPYAGTLTSWTTDAARTANATATMKVLKFHEVVASDGPHVLVPGVPNTFETQIPVEPGESISMNAYSTTPNWFEIATACMFVSGPEDSVGSMVESDTPVGGNIKLNHTDAGYRLNLAATILAPPIISSISPPTGSISGGNAVTITGSNFERVRSVTFGGVDAGFRVDSEGTITSTAPSISGPGPISISVTTVAGTASGSYNYEACVVPSLHGLKVAAARKKLLAAKCALGKVKRLKAKPGQLKRRDHPMARVVSQAPPAGTVEGTGTVIRIKVRASSARH